MKVKQPRKRIAYIVSRFPKITETFILFEILELERLGTEVSVFSILRENEGIMHAEAAPVVERAHYCNAFSWPVLASQLFWLWHAPIVYLRSWWRALKGNASSPSFFARALYIVPVAAHFARQMQEAGIEHVHANWATHPALAAYVIRLLAGIPYSFTAHSHEIYVDRTMLGEKIHESEFFITISQYNRRLLTELYGPECAGKMHVVHCGVDTSLFKPRDAIRANKRFTILCVAGLESIKASDTLSKLARNCAGVKWTFVACWSAEARTVHCSNGRYASWDLKGACKFWAASLATVSLNSWPRQTYSRCKAL